MTTMHRHDLAQHARAYLRRGFRPVGSAQLLERDGRNFYMDIDAVQQRSADLTEILLDLSGRAAAFPSRVSVKSALTPVHVAIGLLRRYTDRQRGGRRDWVWTLPSKLELDAR